MECPTTGGKKFMSLSAGSRFRRHAHSQSNRWSNRFTESSAATVTAPKLNKLAGHRSLLPIRPQPQLQTGIPQKSVLVYVEFQIRDEMDFLFLSEARGHQWNQPSRSIYLMGLRSLSPQTDARSVKRWARQSSPPLAPSRQCSKS